MRRVVQSRNQNDNRVVQQYKQWWHFKNRTWDRAFKKTSGYNFYYQILRHTQCIFVQKQDLKKRNGLIMHKQTWQHYTKVIEEKQSVVFKNNRLFYCDSKKNIFHNQKLPFNLMKKQYAICLYLCTENPKRFTQKEDFEMFIWS